MAAHQNPDDLHCRPVRFLKIDHDGSVVKFYGTFAPWPKIWPIGELMIRETLDGAVHISIALEDGWQDEK